jgi:hypothetical protein
LKNFVSYIIFYFIFNNNYEIPYISDTTNYGLPVGVNYFIPDYFFLRSIYFFICDFFKNPMSFNDIKGELGIITRFERYLQVGTTLSTISMKVQKEIEKLINDNPSFYNQDLINRFNNDIILFNKTNEIRNNNYNSIIGYASIFQLKVHNYIENFFGLKFDSEIPVIDIVKNDTIEVNGKSVIIHYNLRFDGFCELTDVVRKKFGLNKKWKGIIFEAHGLWHIDLKIFLRMFPYKTEKEFLRRQEIDVLKRALCKELGYIIIEIYENLEESQWNSEILKQIQNQLI